MINKRRIDSVTGAGAFFIACIAVAVIAGWFSHSLSLVQLFISIVPMQFNTAVCFLVCTLGLLSLARSARTSAAASVLCLVFATATLLQYALDADYGIDTLLIHPFTTANVEYIGRMAPNTALGFIVCSLALLLCGTKRPLLFRRAFCAALLASFGAALGIIPLLGYICNVQAAYSWGSVIHMALHTCLCFIVLGLTIVAYAWSSSEGKKYWLPVPICIGLMSVSISMSAAVQSQEDAKFEQMLQFEANTIASEGDLQLNELYRAVNRIALRWQVERGTPHYLWQTDADTYIANYPFLTALSRTDTDARIMWISPPTAENARALGFQLTSEPKRAEAIKAALEAHAAKTTRTLDLLHGGKGFLFVTPLYSHEHYDGLLVAVFKIDVLFNDILSHSDFSRFYLTVSDDQPLFSTLPANPGSSVQWHKTASLNTKETHWDITVSPKPQTLAQKNSLISVILLLIGMLTSLLIGLCVFLVLKWKYSTGELVIRERALEKSSSLNNAILSSANYLIIATDIDGTVLVFNREAEETLGWQAREVIGKHTPLLWHVPEEMNKKANELSLELGETIAPDFRTLKHKANLEGYAKGQWSYLRKDGSTFPAELIVTTLRDNEHKVVGYLGIIQDITLRLQQEAKIKNSEETLRLALDHAPIGMALMSLEGRFTRVNKSLCEIVGYSRDEMIQLDFQKITHPDDLTADLNFMAQMLSRDIQTYEMEKRYIHKEGHPVWILLNASLVWSNENKPLYFIIQIQDIAERKAVERIKSEFISTVSHELRTPLTSIRGSLGLMKAGIAGDMAPKAKEMTEIAYNNAERLILLINDILDIDKIESGEMRFDMKEYDAGALVAQAIEANQAYGEKFGVRFILEPFSPPARVRVDTNRLMQVVSNLLSNAAKFSTAGDEVRISIARRDKSIRIYIVDSGPGIPKEFHSRIFSKFAQADSSSTRQKGGTGLGLNISKQIMSHMAGEIGFDSEPGRGSAFWIEIPEISLVKARPIPIEADENLRAAGEDGLPLILHAEDDYDFCLVIAHSLKGKANMHTALTVADASRLLLQNNYRLLILDLALPDGTGLALLNHIKTFKLDIKVMILSASEVSGQVSSLVDCALVKSKVSERDIVSDILSLLDRKQPL